MILWWMIPVFTGFLANLLVPLMIGAGDGVFPRLNAPGYRACRGDGNGSYPAYNFATIPLITAGPYEYGRPERDEETIPEDMAEEADVA